MLDVAKQLKERHAARVFVCTTFGLFTEGFDKFDEYHEKGYIDKVITTNLTYLPPVVKEKALLCHRRYEQIPCLDRGFFESRPDDRRGIKSDRQDPCTAEEI